MTDIGARQRSGGSPRSLSGAHAQARSRCRRYIRHRGGDGTQTVLACPQQQSFHLDLERADPNQPRVRRQAAGRNGELYNYLELRRQLETRGSANRSSRTSASEVPAAILAEYGWQGLAEGKACGASRCLVSAMAVSTLGRDASAKSRSTFRREWSHSAPRSSSSRRLLAVPWRSISITSTLHDQRYKELYKQERLFFLGHEDGGRPAACHRRPGRERKPANTTAADWRC